MKTIEGVRLALQQIGAQKLKSFFAILGVIIGVTFLITVVTVIEGMNQYMQEDFGRRIYGLNTLTIRRTPSIQLERPSDELRRAWRRRPRLRMEDAEALRTQLRTPALVAVESTSMGTVVGDDGTEIAGVMLTSASADFFRIREFDVARGRLFGAPEERTGAPVIVLGHETAEKLFGQREPVGRTVRVNGIEFRVIGVLEEQGTLFGMSLDNRAIAPATSPMARLTSRDGSVQSILVRTRTAEVMPQAALEIEAIMRVRHRLRPSEPNSFEIETAEDSMAFWTRISTILLVAFPGLVAIALIVGGMVIMNIMLVSVTERTREIGIRKAVGAKRRDIHLQVLIESAALSGLGAGLGIALGLIGGRIVSAVSPLPSAIAPVWLTVAALMGIGVGVLAGLYPAARAARLDPIAALRAE